MKKAFVFFLLAWPIIGAAQRNLAELAQRRAAFFREQNERALNYSKSHGIPMTITTKEGATIRLIGVSPSGFPTYFSTFNANAAITTDVVQLRTGGTTGLNLLGDGMVVGVWDGGTVKDHIELGTRVIAKEGSDFETHATHVTGTLIATGINPAAKGMAPNASAIAQDFGNDEVEMAAYAANGLLLSNHSYGSATGWAKISGVWTWFGDPSVNSIEDYRFGFYSDRTQSIDQLAALAPYYTMVWAAGNDRADVGDGTKPPDCNGGAGYDCITPEATAKNVISVGAVDKVLSYTNPFDVSMSFFSSWGPTDDGRIKPDLVGDGVALFSLSADGTDQYTTLTGTSMASPNVCGSLTLLQELYKQLHGGNAMKAATLKALAIHTAKEAGIAQGPDYSFGWGLLDASAAGTLLLHDDNNAVVVKELSLANDSVIGLTLTPKANKKITATIAWTDVPGNPISPVLDPTNRMLVNDLDLRILDENGIEQLPWTLDPSNPSSPATRGDNFRDNVERLEFDLPEGKPYTLTIRQKGTLIGGRQDVSLIITYQPAVVATTYYWVGDAGLWSDASHWATQTGGAPAFQVPAAGDRVIVDENSFDGIGSDLISLTQDAMCGSLLWMNSKISGISFTGHALTIGTHLVLTSAFSVPSAGSFHFQNTTGTGDVFFNNTSLTQVKLFFDGSWSLKGDFAAHEVQVNSGDLDWMESTARILELTALGSPASAIHFNGTSIKLTGSSAINGSTVRVTASRSAIAIDSTQINLQWQTVDWPLPLSVPAGYFVQINGDNHFANISGDGSIIFNGSNSIDSLNLDPGAHVSFAPASRQTLVSSTISGVQALPITLMATADASLVFTNHTKYCFDYLSVDHLNVVGNSVVNAGQNSLVTNSKGWKQADCSTLVFADFQSDDACANSLVKFSDRSSGPVTGYKWKFSDGLTSEDQNAFWKAPSAGSYTATLTVVGNGGADSVTRPIALANNSLPANQIITGNGMLTSLNEATRYQWFYQGAIVTEGTARSFPIESDGTYFVVAYSGNCNSVSDTLTINGIAAQEKSGIFPNPAGRAVRIITDGSVHQLTILDMLGRPIYQQTEPASDIQIDTSGFMDGLYIIQLRSTDITNRMKLIVRHADQ